MVTLDRRLRHLVRYRLVFFPTPAVVDEVTEHLGRSWMARLLAADVERAKGTCVVRHEVTATSCVDLTQELRSIFGAMQASTRNKINKAERMSGRIAVERNGPRAKANFLELYADLARTKSGQITHVDGAVLDRYSQCSDIFLIYLDGKPLCGHINLRDNNIGRTRLLFTATGRFVDHETARVDWTGEIRTVGRDFIRAGWTIGSVGIGGAREKHYADQSDQRQEVHSICERVDRISGHPSPYQMAATVMRSTVCDHPAAPCSP